MVKARGMGSASMMSATVMGMDVRLVRVEVALARGTPMIRIVGLAHGAVREGRERIRAAAAQLGLDVPGLRITVNLAPADLPKTGTALDLPILLAMLCANGDIPHKALEGLLAVGEIGLDGSVRSVRGALPIALHAASDPYVKRLLVPTANLREAAAATEVDVGGADTVPRVLAALAEGGPLGGAPALAAPPETAVPAAGAPPGEGFDLSMVRGQAAAKRALEIAAAGGHNLLLSGSPGSGKTSLARCLPGLLPPMELAEAVDVTSVHSVAGLVPDGAGLSRSRPFRAPHHSISEAGLIGGGGRPRPGEASLAHCGVLFLDELPEFGRRALEALRQPIEEGWVRIVRAAGSASFPAEFTLVAAMNPCPCGYLGVSSRCCCSALEIGRYRRRVSGPLLDRIDLLVDVPPVRWLDLAGARPSEGSAEVRRRAVGARRLAVTRQGCTNARLPAARLESACASENGAREMLRRAVTRLDLSARGYHRVLRVARTVADLAGRAAVSADDVTEAIRYRGSL